MRNDFNVVSGMHASQVPICYKITLKKSELKNPIRQKNRQVWGIDPLRAVFSSAYHQKKLFYSNLKHSQIFLKQKYIDNCCIATGQGIIARCIDLTLFVMFKSWEN
jgi:hypothetical protein